MITIKEYIDWVKKHPWHTDEVYAKEAIEKEVDDIDLLKAAKNYIDSCDKFFNLLNDICEKEELEQ